MQAYQTRVVEEKAELDEKIAKLGIFLGRGDSIEIEKADRDLLVNQLDAMSVYSDILNQRIARFKAE